MAHRLIPLTPPLFFHFTLPLSTFIVQDTHADNISCNYGVDVSLSHATPALAQSAMVLLNPVVVFPASRIRSSIFSHTRGTPEARWQKFRLYNSKEDDKTVLLVSNFYIALSHVWTLKIYLYV
jgi:hypothetical protein